jgi:hypothetical protein
MNDAAPHAPIDICNLDAVGYQRLYAERIKPVFCANEDARVQAEKNFRRAPSSASSAHWWLASSRGGSSRGS